MAMDGLFSAETFRNPLVDSTLQQLATLDLMECVDRWDAGDQYGEAFAWACGVDLAEETLKVAREHRNPLLIALTLSMVIATGKESMIANGFVSKLASAAYAGSHN